MNTHLESWWSLLCVRKGDFMRTPAGALSCADLATLVQQFTAKFDEFALVAGDKILIVVDDERVAVSTFVAALFNGLVPVMLTPATPANRVESVQQSIHAKAAVVSLGKRQEPWLKSISHPLVFQPDLVKNGAVEIRPFLVRVEKVGNKIFTVWSNLIIKKKENPEIIKFD